VRDLKPEVRAERVLVHYLRWGIASLLSFILFISALFIALSSGMVHFLFIFLLLLSGFLWIGLTSISRHAYILVKRAIGKEATVTEFLGTQLGILFFPAMYFRLKKEVDEYRQKRK
jgi:hypothetical protein